MLTARVDTAHTVSAVFMGPSAAAVCCCCCCCMLLLLLLLLHDACCRYRVSMDTRCALTGPELQFSIFGQPLQFFGEAFFSRKTQNPAENRFPRTILGGRIGPGRPYRGCIRAWRSEAAEKWVSGARKPTKVIKAPLRLITSDPNFFTQKFVSTVRGHSPGRAGGHAQWSPSSASRRRGRWPGFA